jgi:NAD(P)-dependent dehydrogenase (short-subunit alcohol dehydrogenase family)
MDLGLNGKAVLITGGASGIGEAATRLFVQEGARVAIVDRDEARGLALAAELDGGAGRAAFVLADLTREADCRNAIEETLRAFGRLDIVVNNAGVNDTVGLEAAPEAFLGSLQRNLFHVFAVTHFAAPHLRAARGAIVNVSSKVAETGQGRTSGYAAAKGGINALTREWAVAFAADGVRVNAVVPAECLTPLYERWLATLPDGAARRKAIERLVPLGARFTTAEEIAAAILFLASPRSGHTTGQLLHVDGGYTHLDRAFNSTPGSAPGG